MAKKYLKTLMLVMAGCALLSFIIYGCIGFTYAKFNPFDWEEGARATLSFFTGMMFIFSFIIAAVACSD